MSLSLTNIPVIMRHHGWHNGAALLDSWFGRPSAIAPSYGPPDTTTIRLDTWALTFSRARQVYDQLIRDRIWANVPGQREIASLLRRQSLLTTNRQTFGGFNRPLPALDADYINFRAVTFSTSDLDDMTAALGSFVFRVVVAGAVQPRSGSRGHDVEINQVGVYIRDSFDFNGNQFLGFWDDSDNSVSMTNPFSGTSVSNADFRTWRANHGAGGDFLIFSDLKVIKLTMPDRFTI
jgi:Family of unknown function (DUF6402)